MGLFEEQANKTLDECKKIYEQRGGEYSDTWRNCPFNALKATLAKLGFDSKYNELIDEAEILRAIAAAVLVDIKYSRLAGGYKEDSVVDGINYAAVWVQEMKNK